MRRIIITICLLLTGIGLFSYPYVSNMLAEKGQSYAVQEYEEEMSRIDEEVLAEERAKAEKYNKNLTGEYIEDPFVEGSGMVLQDDYMEILNIGGTMGYVEVPDINVNLPLYHGTAEDVLQKGVGHLQGTSFPVGGASTHAVLTGHTGLTSAKLFTDLIELEEGDIFYLHILDEILAYEIDQIKVIEPSITEDLRVVEGEDYVTLVTCTPYGINSHRLLVRGVRTEYSPELKEQYQAKASKGLTTEHKLLILVSFITVAIMFMAAFIIQQREKRRQIELMKQQWIDGLDRSE